MTALIAPLFAIAGAIVGSFINVVALRFPVQGVVAGRSACLSCGTKLQWFELVPVLSFILLWGRCRTCRVPLSFQYPFVELALGAIFLLLYFRVPDPVLVALFAIGFSLLLLIAVYDFRHLIIPGAFLYPLIATGLVLTLYRNPAPSIEWLAGPLLTVPFLLLFALSRGRLMGFADSTLALGVGWLLGLSGSAVAFLVSFWIGAVVGVVLLARGRRLQSEIPFAPFLVAGALLTVLGDISLFELLSALTL